jgi:hypothetical protein
MIAVAHRTAQVNPIRGLIGEFGSWCTRVWGGCDGYLRTLLVHGARAYLRVVGKQTGDNRIACLEALLDRAHDKSR